MKIAQIVPAAFEYFDDIKKNAFEIVEKLSSYGVESHIATLQYEQPKRRERAKLTGEPSQGIKGAAPSYSFKGLRPIDQVISSLSQYDLVHLHCPFLGAAGRIYNWKKKDPDTPLVITYYRQVELADLLSFFIRLYNNYYLPKIFNLADVVTVFPQTWKKFRFPGLSDKKIVYITPESDKWEEDYLAVDLTNYSSKVKLEETIISEFSVSKILAVYSALLG